MPFYLVHFDYVNMDKQLAWKHSTLSKICHRTCTSNTSIYAMISHLCCRFFTFSVFRDESILLFFPTYFSFQQFFFLTYFAQYLLERYQFCSHVSKSTNICDCFIRVFCQRYLLCWGTCQWWLFYSICFKIMFDRSIKILRSFLFLMC